MSEIITLRMPSSNSTTRFSDRAGNYDLYRPLYPTAVIDYLEKTIGLNEKTIVADIGSGTGILSVLFLEAGCVVKAVEPNEAMRSLAVQKLQRYKTFENIDGTAEQTTLPDHSVDLITVAQAFHWFNLPVVKQEFKRILKPGGYVLLAWNILQDDTPFLKAYNAIRKKYEDQHAHPDHADLHSIQQFFAPKAVEVQSFRNIQLRDEEGLKGLLSSSSKIPKPGDSRYADMMNELAIVSGKYAENGLLKLEYETKLFLSQIS